MSERIIELLRDHFLLADIDAYQVAWDLYCQENASGNPPRPSDTEWQDLQREAARWGNL